jgi:hypothetical protein
MVVYAYNSELRRLRQEDSEFKVSLSYIARLHLKKKKNQPSYQSRMELNLKNGSMLPGAGSSCL